MDFWFWLLSIIFSIVLLIAYIILWKWAIENFRWASIFLGVIWTVLIFFAFAWFTLTLYDKGALDWFWTNPFVETTEAVATLAGQTTTATEATIDGANANGNSAITILFGSGGIIAAVAMVGELIRKIVKDAKKKETKDNQDSDK